jgi:hypothetical protein
MSPQLVIGLLYARVEGAWLLGDACVTDVMFVFVSQAAPVQFHVNLHDIERSQSLTLFEADFDVDVFELTLRTKAALRFKALSALEQRDWADTIDELIAPQCYYPHSMPLTHIRHPKPETLPKDKIPLQVTLMEAAKAKAKTIVAQSSSGSSQSAETKKAIKMKQQPSEAEDKRQLERVGSTRSSLRGSGSFHS